MRVRAGECDQLWARYRDPGHHGQLAQVLTGRCVHTLTPHTATERKHAY